MPGCNQQLGILLLCQQAVAFDSQPCHADDKVGNAIGTQHKSNHSAFAMPQHTYLAESAAVLQPRNAGCRIIRKIS